MIYTSLAVLAMSASIAVMPPSKFVHLHPHSAQPDTRVSLTIVNHAPIFQDVEIDGHEYTVPAHQSLGIKAPVGTIIFADSSTGSLKRGAIVAQITPQMQAQSIDIK